MLAWRPMRALSRGRLDFHPSALSARVALLVRRTMRAPRAMHCQQERARRGGMEGKAGPWR